MCIHVGDFTVESISGDTAGFLGVAAIASDRFAGGLDLQIATWGETSGTVWW